MSNTYAKGAQPKCPVKGPKCLGVVSMKGARSCHACSRMRPAAPPVLTAMDQRPVETVSVTGDTCEIAKTSHEQVRSLDALIRVCEIDTLTWEVERFVCNKWEMGAKDRNDDLQVRPLYQVKAWLKRKVHLIAARDEIAALVADAKTKISPRRVSGQRMSGAGTDYLLELAIPDLHLGKLAWGRETGHGNYDSKIAEQVFEDALAALLHRTNSYRFGQILLVVGNDLLNADNIQGTTTRGTQQDTDGRYHKSFSIARRMITRTIEQARQLAPVKVLVVPGNHDTLAAWHLGDSLECYFHNTPDVQIDNEPTQRKYHQFGQVMLMFTHGDKGKRLKYPQVMAAEQPQMWGATVHREAHTGHLHQLRVEESHGVKVRISPALCPPDAWHAEQQFIGNARAAEAFVWHRTEGLVGMAIYTVPKTVSEAA